MTGIFPGVVHRVRTSKPLATASVLRCFHLWSTVDPPSPPKLDPQCGFGNITLLPKYFVFFLCFVFCGGKPLYIWGLHKWFSTNDLQAHPELSLEIYIPDTTPREIVPRWRTFCVFTWKWAHQGYSKSKPIYLGWVHCILVQNPLASVWCKSSEVLCGLICVLFPTMLTCDIAIWEWLPGVSF